MWFFGGTLGMQAGGGCGERSEPHGRAKSVTDLGVVRSVFDLDHNSSELVTLQIFHQKRRLLVNDIIDTLHSNSYVSCVS